MSALDDLVNRSNWQIGTVIIIGGDNRYSAEYIGDDPSLSEAADELAELRNELSDEEESRKFAQACLEQEEQKNIALRERVEALEWVVKRLEYIKEYPSEEYLCPICRGEKPTHYEDCELAAALARLDNRPPKV